MDRAGWNYPSGDIRVSDADRDRALSELSEAFQVGRIAADEFDERSGQALSARTGRELAALLADLPVEVAPAARTAPLDQPAPLDQRHRVFAAPVAFAAAVAALCFAAVAAANALSTGATLQQRELFRQFAARHGLSAPGLPPSPGFNWTGTITPAVVAVLLVVLVICLRGRLARDDGR